MVQRGCDVADERSEFPLFFAVKLDHQQISVSVKHKYSKKQLLVVSEATLKILGCSSQNPQI